MMKGLMLHIMLLLASAAALLSCADDSMVASLEPGMMSITLTNNGLAVKTRADSEEDRENYIDMVDIFFYPGGSYDEAPAYRITGVDADCYNTTTIKRSIDANAIETIFPDDSSDCLIYAVANVHDLVVAVDNPTINNLRNIVLHTDFPNVATADILFAMDGLGTLTLNDDMSMSGNISLSRALAKVCLALNVSESITLDDGSIYRPILSNSLGESTVYAEMYNSATNGLLNGMVDDGDGRGLTGTGTNVYMKSYSGEHDKMTHDPFYSYPNEWKNNFLDQETSIKLVVPWKKDGDNGYEIYYYQIPVNYNGKRLERNNLYDISLKVGMLGSTDPNAPLVVEDMDYNIMDWSSVQTSIDAEVSKSHYLVVEGNSFTIWNQDELSFSYETCSQLEFAKLVSVSYESTRYPDSSGNATTVYLYNSSYDKKTGEYVESSSYSDNSKSVRSTYSAVVTYLTNTLTITNSKADGSTKGTITFKADVSQTAGVIYRPLKYVIALKNDASHSAFREEITITQYPSKYIEFTSAGNVFVNGYYGRLSTQVNGGVENASGYYRSYSFIYDGYTDGSGTTNSVDYTGYYKSTSNAATNVSWYSGLSSLNVVSNQSAVNTSYDYVRGVLPTKSVNFEKCVNVYVSAFSKSDNTFSLTADNYTLDTYTGEYIIGDPRVSGGFVKNGTHDTSGYDYKSNYLYDYLVYCGSKSESTNNGSGPRDSGGSTTTTNYYRYVNSWGDKASNIKVGGKSTDYDNIIAPEFKIQSSYGAASSTVYFDVAQKRCATYQEAGYPAGRWRLPTLAELYFLISLQNKGVIDKMFDNSNHQAYWTSSGGGVMADNLTYYYGYATRKSTGLCNVRCVYDIWYWGDTPESSTTTYYPKP